MDECIEQLFNKSETYHRGKLKNEYVFKEISVNKPWSNLICDDMYNEINLVKSKLNDIDIENWHKHTDRLHVTLYLKQNTKKFSLELPTQAWFKFMEILVKYQIAPSLTNDVPKQFNSFHLCEAPGAFITALNQYIFNNNILNSTTWDWSANTLNPYFEDNTKKAMIDDDRLLRPTLHRWLFGEDNSGDITKIKNIKHIITEIKSRYNNIHLVTADGSMDCSQDPAHQERDVAILHFAEVSVALSVLAANGTLVVKMFTMYETSTLCLMFLLSKCFTEIDLFKPVTSKGGNSEVYLICKYYQKSNAGDMIIAYLEQLEKDGQLPHQRPLFTKAELSKQFLQHHLKVISTFHETQLHFIQYNLKIYEKYLKMEDEHRLKYMQKKTFVMIQIVNAYISKMNLMPLTPEARLVFNRQLSTGTYLRSIGKYAKRYECYKRSERHLMPLHEKYNIMELDDMICFNECVIVNGSHKDLIQNSKFCCLNHLHDYNAKIEKYTPTNDPFYTNTYEEFISMVNKSLLNYGEKTEHIQVKALHIVNLLNVPEMIMKMNENEHLLVYMPIPIDRFYAGFVYLLCTCFKQVLYLPTSQSATHVYFLCLELHADVSLRDTQEVRDYFKRVFSGNVLQWVPIGVLTNKYFLEIFTRWNNNALEMAIQLLNQQSL